MTDAPTPKTDEQKPDEQPAPKPADQKTDKPDSEKTVDELKAEAEAAEAAYKAKRGELSEEEIRQNQIRRRDKAREKAAELENSGGDTTTKPKDGDVDTRDLITLGKADIAEDSDKAKILGRYKAGGLIKNFAEGLEHPGVKAEFDALDAKNNAKTVVDENDTAENRLKTKKEIVESYKKSGEVPEDPDLRKAIAESNLESMPQVR